MTGVLAFVTWLGLLVGLLQMLVMASLAESTVTG